MMERDILIFGRRIHYGLRSAIEDGDGRTDMKRISEERPELEHYYCSIYLIGCLAFLEGEFGSLSWKGKGKNHDDFDFFITSSNIQSFSEYKICKSGLEALICIRNSITHNKNNVSLNFDSNCIHKINDAGIIGVIVKENIVSLISNDNIDFMEYVRLSFIAVSMYHGKK